MNELPPYITRQEAAKLLRVSVRTLDNWLRDRLISHVKIGVGRGGRVIIRRVALEGIIANLEVPATKH